MTQTPQTAQTSDTAQLAEKKVNQTRLAILDHIGQAIAQLNALPAPYQFSEEDINDLARVSRRVASIPFYLES